MGRFFCGGDILIPENVDLQKWATIACDQYTSDPDYWHSVEEFVGSDHSALHLILPEIYLDKADNLVPTIHGNMHKYLDNNLFKIYKNSCVFTLRKLQVGGIRKGLVGIIDLTQYGYEENTQLPIRATEKTVLERIPPRVKIRRNAPLELPHVLILIDDPSFDIIEPLETLDLPTVYDTKLMFDAGSISGKLLQNEQLEATLQKIDCYINAGKLLLVGDGNHSLATAKNCMSPSNLNSRFAMVELVNIHDETLEFEPIHRVLFNCEPRAIIAQLMKRFNGEFKQKISYAFNGEKFEVELGFPDSGLSVGHLQQIFDEIIGENRHIQIDYIHGEDDTLKLCKNDTTLGVFMNSMGKSTLFESVRNSGSLPRKTFSMGHANDKRFYLESRRIL